MNWPITYTFAHQCFWWLTGDFQAYECAWPWCQCPDRAIFFVLDCCCIILKHINTLKRGTYEYTSVLSSRAKEKPPLNKAVASIVLTISGYWYCQSADVCKSAHSIFPVPRLTRLHGNPFAWWMGQILKYLTRPQPTLTELIEQKKKTLGFVHPIVGWV